MEPDSKRGKRLISATKQLRGWVGSDPSKEPDLIDALNALTEHRLLTHAAGEAIPDAQEAFTRAYRAAPTTGTLGPLTKTGVIARQLVAMAHLAALQAATGQPESAAQTASAALSLRLELGRPELDAALTPPATVWLLSAVARGAAASGDLAQANAYADAALARTRDERFVAQKRFVPLAIDTESLVADLRWAAGIEGDALDHSRRALSLAQARADALVSHANNVAPADLLQATRPVAPTRRDLADRLAAVGDRQAAVAERTVLVDWLRTLPGRARHELRGDLALALVDLAADLSSDAERAVGAAREAADIAVALATAESGLGLLLTTHTALAHASLRAGDPEAAARALGEALQAHDRAGTPASVAASYALALACRADIEDALDLAESAAVTRTEFCALADHLLDQTVATRLLYGTVPAEQFVRDQARGVVTRSLLPTPSWSSLPPVAALADAATAGSAEAVIPSAEPAPAATPVPQPVRKPEPEPVVVPEPEPEPVTEPEPEPELEPVTQPTASDPADAARALLRAGRPAEAEDAARAALQVYRPALETAALLSVIAEARSAQGDRKGVPAIANQVVEQVRPLAEADPSAHGGALVDALQALSEARKAAGDWWGSLAPGREAKQWAKRLGL